MQTPTRRSSSKPTRNTPSYSDRDMRAHEPSIHLTVNR
jgi:hypothetical protein